MDWAILCIYVSFTHIPTKGFFFLISNQTKMNKKKQRPSLLLLIFSIHACPIWDVPFCSAFLLQKLYFLDMGIGNNNPNKFVFLFFFFFLIWTPLLLFFSFPHFLSFTCSLLPTRLFIISLSITM